MIWKRPGQIAGIAGGSIGAGRWKRPALGTFKPTTPAPTMQSVRKVDAQTPAFIPKTPAPIFKTKALPVAGTFTGARRYTKTDTAAQGAASRTALDYFNRYVETALSTVGTIADTYAGFAWDKNTWDIAKQRIQFNMEQIWSPPALEAKDEAGAVGRAAGNLLSLTGTAIVVWQLGSAFKQFSKQLQLSAKRVYQAEDVVRTEEFGKFAPRLSRAIGDIPVGGGKAGISKGLVGAPEMPSLTFTNADVKQWAAQFKMSIPDARASLKLLAEVAKTPYTPSPNIIGEFGMAKTGFNISQTGIIQTVPGLPSGQSTVLGFIMKNPTAAVKLGVVPNTATITRLTQLAEQVTAGKVPIASLQSAMQTAIPSFAKLSHYAEVTAEPMEKAIAEQFRLGVPSGEVTATVTPRIARVRAALPAITKTGTPAEDATLRPAASKQTTVPTRWSRPAIAPAQTSPVAAISTQETSIPTPPVVTPPQIAPQKEQNIYPAAQEGYTILYHQTTAENLDGVKERGIDATHPGPTSEQGTGAIWATRVPGEVGQYGGNMVAFRVPNSDFDKDNARGASLTPGGDTVVVLHSIKPEDILAIYRGMEVEVFPGVKAYTREDKFRAMAPEDQAMFTSPKGTPTLPAQTSPVAKISPQEASVPTVAPTIAQQIAPAEIVQPPAAPTISKMEIPPSTEQPSVVPVVGMKLRDTKTAVTYTIDNVVKPRGGNVAWVEASDTHGNSIKIDGAAIGQRYVPSVTNTAPLPAGQTTSGQEVTPMNTAVEPSATSGTSPTIPADADSISRITVAFNKLSDAKKSGGIKKQNIDAFYRAMSEAGVPPKAIFWKKYHMIEHMRSPEKQMETVRAEVEKYNAKVLGKKITDIAHVREAKRAVKEAVATVKGQSREQLAESQRRDAEILKKQRADDVYLRESAVAKQKAHDDALLATTKKRDANLAKTLDWIQAEKDLKAREKEEAAAIIEYLTNLDLRNMHAQEAREIQTAVAGVVELKHPFVKQGDTAFSWLMQGKGIHVVDATIPATAQKTLNLPELRALKAKVKALADLSTEERDAIRVREKEALGKEIDDCTTELSGHSSAKKLPAVRKGIYHGPEKKTAIRAALDKVHEVPVFLDITFDRMQYTFQILGGYKKGKVWHSLYNKIYAADRATAQDVNAQMELAHERLSSLGITAKTMGKLRTLPNGITVTQRDALFAAVYAGNGETLEKIMAGNGWTEEDISLAIKSMSKEEVAWTNYMLDDMRMMYPLIADAYARTNQGASLPDILNYFPAISQRGTDVFLGQPGKDAVHPAEQMTIDSLSFYGWGKEGAVGDKPSFVKRREGGPQVLQVDPIRTYFTYKEHALDYIHRAPVVATMRAIVNDKNFKDEYILAAGEQRYAALVEYVDAISNPQKALAPKTPVERVARILRWNASAGTLGGRVSKAITAFMSYGLGWGRYGPSAMAVGSYQLVSNFHGAMGTIEQYAPLLYQRLADPARWDALIAEAERAWGGGTQLSARKLSNLGFAVGDTLDVASSFLGYTWDLLRKHPDWTLEQASYEAEQDILQTHTSRLVQDRPPIYRQTELGQALVAFTGEATSQSMALMHDAKSAFHGKTSRAKFIAEWFTLTMGVTLMGMAADAIARGRKKKTAKELGFWGTVFGRFILAQIDMFPLVGRWVSGSLRGFTGQNDLITLKAISEAQQLIPDFIKAVGDQNPAYLGKAGLHLLRFIGYGLGMPVLGVDEFKNWIHPDNPPATLYPMPSGQPTVPHMAVPKPPRP